MEQQDSRWQVAEVSRHVMAPARKTYSGHRAVGHCRSSSAAATCHAAGRSVNCRVLQATLVRCSTEPRSDVAGIGVRPIYSSRPTLLACLALSTHNQNKYSATSLSAGLTL